MTSCWACETELRPEWKFCIQCGVPVEHDSSASSEVRTRGPLFLFGWIFAGIGLALVLALVAILVFR